MDSRYAVQWKRPSGQTIRIEDMTDLELVRAHHALEREDGSDPLAGTLLEAIVSEVECRVNPVFEAERKAA